MPSVYVFGDTGGHGFQLFSALSSIGVDLANLKIPEGVKIVHLGDLIHRGPASDTIVSQVDKLIRSNPGQWLQTLGNHEFQHIVGGIDFWNCDCSLQTAAIIQAWYDEGLARIAWPIEGIVPQSSISASGLSSTSQSSEPLSASSSSSFRYASGSFLATHGGLTFPIWQQLGEPSTATEAAELLNLKSGYYSTLVGESMGINRYGAVGPVWAMAVQETFKYWDLERLASGQAMPFGQLIGHSAPYDFSSQSWWSNVPLRFRESSKVYPRLLRTLTRVGDRAMICMDPGYGAQLGFADHPEQPYLKLKTEEE